MKPQLLCLLTGLLLNIVAFSQTDSLVIRSTVSFLKPHHFNNPLYKYVNTRPKPTQYFSFLRGSELFVAPHSSFRAVRYSSYSDNIPLWKELISTAGKIAISTYEDNHSLLHFYPRH